MGESLMQRLGIAGLDGLDDDHMPVGSCHQVAIFGAAVEDLETLTVHEAAGQHRLDHRHMRGGEKAQVEVAVVLQQGIFVLLQSGKAHHLQMAFQRLHQRAIGCFGHADGGPAFDVMADVQQLAHVFGIRRGNMGVAAGAADDQPFLGQAHQGLADGALGHLETLGQLQLAQHLARSQLAENDLAAQSLLNQLAAAGLCPGSEVFNGAHAGSSVRHGYFDRIDNRILIDNVNRIDNMVLKFPAGRPGHGMNANELEEEMMARIELAKVVKRYGAVEAIHGVDLEIGDGEFVAFVGPSGCGKSTMLRMIAGLEEISGGTLRIGEAVVNDVEPKGRDVAMVFQDYALYPHMSVAQNIGFGLKMRGEAPEVIRQKVEDAARILQLEDYLERKPGQLSGGQRQRVAMGRAIVRKPKVFLFDEPLSNLDAKLRVEMRTQIKRLHRMLRTTTIYVTHDQVEAMTLADRVVVLRGGNLIQHGRPLELYERPNCRFVAEFIGSPQMNILPGVVISSDGSPAVELDGGAMVRTPGLAAEPGRKVDVGIRPEHIEACSEAGADLVVDVDVLEELGSDTLAICLWAGRELTVRLPAGPGSGLGSIQGSSLGLAARTRLPLRFRRDCLHVFDAQTGVRL